jgi:hypothetical protein
MRKKQKNPARVTSQGFEKQKPIKSIHVPEIKREQQTE